MMISCRNFNAPDDDKYYTLNLSLLVVRAIDGNIPLDMLLGFSKKGAVVTTRRDTAHSTSSSHNQF